MRAIFTEESVYYGLRDMRSVLYDEPLFDVEPDYIAKVIADVAESHGVIFDVTPQLKRMNGRAGYYRSKRGYVARVSERLMDNLSQFIATSIHEITHIKLQFGTDERHFRTGPADESEAYIVEYRVCSAFGLIPTSTFIWRLKNYGARNNVEMVRIKQCIDFADDLILEIAERVGAG